MASNQNSGQSQGGQGSGSGRQSSGGSPRGLAAADEETRERVAREGGEASHGGGKQD